MLRKTNVLKLLQQGKTASEIAQITNTRIGTVRAHITRLTDAGLWKSRDGLQWALDLDQATDFLIDRLMKAKLVPELETKINRLENQKAAIENELLVLRQQIKEKEDRARRYKLAIQHGEVKEPLSA